MAKPEEKNPEKTRPARLDMEDVIFLAGLVFVLVGLGMEVGWGWGLLAVGVILVGMTAWLAAPGSGK
jgi:hypothetical protein